MDTPRTIHTIGHSTRSLEDFLSLLRLHGIRTLADIRRYPGSRRHPHFSPPSFEQSVRSSGVGYLHIPRLGGRRSGVPGSPNAAWRNSAFRGYADRMSSAEFRSGLERLLAAATPVARVNEDGSITYPGEEQQGQLF